MAISRMQEPRQLYGLGSLVRKITRPIKKAVKGVSKIAKSPIGKAAILAGLGAYAGGLGPFAKGARFGNVGGAGFLRNMFAARSVPGVPDFVTGGKPSFLSTLNPFGSNFSLKNLGFTAGAAGALLPFVAPKLLAPKEEDIEEIDYTVQPGGITELVEQARDFYRTGGDGTLQYMPNKKYVTPNFYDYANGGRVGLFSGGSPMKELGLDEDYIREIRIQWIEAGKPGRFSEFLRNELDRQAELSDEMKAQMANGGRVGFDQGGLGIGALGRMMQPGKSKSKDLDLMTIKATLNQVYTNNDDGEGGGYEAVMKFMEENPDYKVNIMENIIGDRGDKIRVAPIEKTSVNILDRMDDKDLSLQDGVLIINSDMFEKKARGGRVGAEEGGLMNLNGLEMDFRANGGFVPIGAKEKADDVPARLSKNEFVMTADAVRGAGGGSIERGAQKMYNTMKELESRVV